MCLPQRNGHCKAAPPAVGTLGTDGAAMQLAKLLNQRQSNTGSFIIAALGALHAMKTIENAR